MASSTFSVADGTHAPVAPSKKLEQQPRKGFQDLNNAFRSTNTSEIRAQDGPSEHSSSASVQNGVRGTQQQSTLPEDDEHRQPIDGTPKVLHFNLKSDADFQAVDPGVERIDHTVTSITTTTTKAEERKSTDGQEAEQTATTFSSQTVAGQKDGVQSSIRSSVSRKASFYQDPRFPLFNNADQSPSTFSSTTTLETRRFETSLKSVHNVVQENFIRIEHSRRGEMDHISNLMGTMTTEYEECKRFYETRCFDYEAEIRRLLQENSALTVHIKLLEIRSHPPGDIHPEIPLQREKMDTTITTITTTITTVTTRIEQWKRRVDGNKGPITISGKEVEQLSLELSTTTSQMNELLQHYTELSKDFSTVREQLQLTLLLRDEKDRTIASLTAEVDQWKLTDSERAQQFAAVRRDNESLRRDSSAASSREDELQRRYDAQLKELNSARNELQTNSSLINEKNLTISSITSDVARLKQSDSTKAEQMTSMRRDYEKLQREFSALTSQKLELQARYDAKSKELSSVRNDLQTHKSLVEERDRTISTLRAEVDGRERADAVREEQIAAGQRDKEKLQQDLVTLSSQTAELRARYDAQSKEIILIRSDLQAKILLLEEKERFITSRTTEVAEAKRQVSVKERQVLDARRDVEQLQEKLSSASSRIADFQKRYETQSRELNSVRDELHQIKILYLNGADSAGELSEHEVAHQIAGALEQKNKEMEELRRDLAEHASRNTKLQESYESLLRKLRTAEDEFKVKISQKEGIIATSTTQAEQLKRSDATKSEQLATALKRVEKYQQDLFSSTSQLAELQRRYEVQSGELITIRKDLQTMTSSDESKGRTIDTLTAERDQWKRSDASKAERITIILRQVENLQSDLSASTSKLATLQGRYDVQSSELSSVRKELDTKTLLLESEARTTRSLTAELEQLKRADATKAEQIAVITKQVEKYQLDLSASTSKLAELRGRYDVQTRDLESLRIELQSQTSSNEDKDRAIVALTAQVDEWKRTDVLKEERIAAARKQAEGFQRDLAKSSSQITELQMRYDAQSTELRSLQEQLKDTKDHAVSSLISQVEEWKRLHTIKTEELTTTRRDLEQVHTDLATSSSQLERWRLQDTTREKELTTARNDLDQLRRDLSTSSAQVLKYQQLSETQSAQLVELTSQIEQWKLSDSAKAAALSVAREKLEQLQRDLSTSSSRIIELQQLCETRLAEIQSLRSQLQATSTGGDKEQVVAALNIQIEQWKRADAAKAEELELLRSKLSSSQTTEVNERIMSEVKDYDAIIKLTTTVDEWLHADAERAKVLELELAKRNKENEELRSNLITLKEIYIRAPQLKQIFHSQTVEIKQRYEEQSRKLESALAERQSQLDGVQRFVTTADTYADTAIMQMLQKLNAEVQQSTTLMAEYIIENIRPLATKLTKEQSSVAKKVSGLIGQTLVDCLRREELDDVGLYLPIAFQAYLTYHLRWMISSWTIENGYNDRIKKIYEELQKSEAQTISGRWRSLTRAYISPTCLSDPTTLISDTMQGLSDIVVVAGFVTSSSSAKSKVLSKFEDKVSGLISTAGRFSKMIGEVVSADFEVLAVSPLEMFEEETMEEDVDDYDKGKGHGTAAGQKVICSTHLGMVKRMQLEAGKKDMVTVIKAKVILESFLAG